MYTAHTHEPQKIVIHNSFLSAVRLLFSDQFSSLKTDIDGYERKRIKIHLRRGNKTLLNFLFVITVVVVVVVVVIAVY